MDSQILAEISVPAFNLLLLVNILCLVFTIILSDLRLIIKQDKGTIIKLRDGFKTQQLVDRRFRLVSTVLNNGNRLEPGRTTGQLAVGF